MKKFFYFFILLILTAFSAFSQRTMPNVNFIYSPAKTLRPQYRLYLGDDDSVFLYVKLNFEELNFAQIANHRYKANVRIKYLYYRSLENLQIVDSASKVLNIVQKNINKTIVSYLKIPKPDTDMFVVIVTEDMYNKNKVLNFLTLDLSRQSSEYFILKDSAYHSPVFKKYVKCNKKYYVETTLQIDSFTVHHYQYDTMLPVPPFSSLKKDFFLVEDTSFKIAPMTYFSFDKPGIYRFVTSEGGGFTVVCFDNYYPYILRASEMIEPLKYLTTTEEYNNLLSYPNKKLAVDDYWLSVDSNYQEARNLIKIYYNRVQLANYYFTEDKPGWMTDRGMIYIIFGTPNVVYKGNNYEQWLYYGPYSKESLDFRFYLKKTDYGCEKYILKRNSNYMTYWKKAINSWRSGQFFVF